MNYTEISKETVSFLYKAHASLNQSPLDQGIRALLELRVSQINGCAYCCKIHSKEARERGITQEKLDQLPAWETSRLFTEKESAALQWCDQVTLLNEKGVYPREKLGQYFSEREIVDITVCISLMGALNRMAICLRD